MSAGDDGSFSSGEITCGNGKDHLTLRPGSFGYVGYEDERGNFVYTAFAAPTHHVMADYPFIEGWVDIGAVRPRIIVRDANGGVKHDSVATPVLLYAINQKLFLNTYYAVTTAQFIAPGDTVTITSGDRADTIAVDRVTAYFNTDTGRITGHAPPGALVSVIPAKDRHAYQDVTADASGVYRTRDSFTRIEEVRCSESTPSIAFQPGDAGRVYVRHADGNAVFTTFGRSLHVNLNNNYVEVYLFPTHDLSWEPVAAQTVSVTLPPRQGTPVTAQAKSVGRQGKVQVYLTDAQNQKVLIRAGDRLTVSFVEGPTGMTRPASLTIDALPLVTASPDPDTSTSAGVGPPGWSGRAMLNAPPMAHPETIELGAHAAYAPLVFHSLSGAPLALVRGYSGTVSFSSTEGHRVWTAWAVTAHPVKITSHLRPGETQVCGVAPPGTSVRIHDATVATRMSILASGVADQRSSFCMALPPLVEERVLLAEADGVFSQPVIVSTTHRVMLPITVR